MSKLFAVLFLAATISAQAPAYRHPKLCSGVKGEDIPVSAVEPYNHPTQGNICPREDYELKWYVEVSKQIDYQPYTNGGVILTSGVSGNNSFQTKDVLVFKPMCVPKEDK